MSYLPKVMVAFSLLALFSTLAWLFLVSRPKEITQPSVVTPVVTVIPDLALTSDLVAAHSNSSDCWLIIENRVYDVTSYLNDHPGGRLIIIPFCGKDATQAFKTQGNRGENHSSSAYLLLKKYLLGPVVKD